jgi:hypothetical protein
MKHARLFAAVLGLMAGVGAVVIVVLILTVIRTEGLAESNKTRLSEQASGVKVGLDILCKLKKYDLTTGLPALKARREAGAEHDPQRAVILERALLLVLSIPSSETCLAIPEPTIPKADRGPSPKTLLHQLEHGGQSEPPNATPRIEREATPPTAGHRGARGPAGSRGPAGKTAPSTTTTPATTVTTTTPASITPAAPPPATTSSAPPLVEPPTVTSTTPTTTTPAPPAEPPKKHGPLGVCIEALGLEVLC